MLPVNDRRLRLVSNANASLPTDVLEFSVEKKARKNRKSAGNGLMWIVVRCAKRGSGGEKQSFCHHCHSVAQWCIWRWEWMFMEFRANSRETERKTNQKFSLRKFTVNQMLMCIVCGWIPGTFLFAVWSCCVGACWTKWSMLIINRFWKWWNGYVNGVFMQTIQVRAVYSRRTPHRQ